MDVPPDTEEDLEGTRATGEEAEQPRAPFGTREREIARMQFDSATVVPINASNVSAKTPFLTALTACGIDDVTEVITTESKAQLDLLLDQITAGSASFDPTQRASADAVANTMRNRMNTAFDTYGDWLDGLAHCALLPHDLKIPREKSFEMPMPNASTDKVYFWTLPGNCHDRSAAFPTIPQERTSSTLLLGVLLRTAFETERIVRESCVLRQGGCRVYMIDADKCGGEPDTQVFVITVSGIVRAQVVKKPKKGKPRAQAAARGGRGRGRGRPRGRGGRIASLRDEESAEAVDDAASTGESASVIAPQPVNMFMNVLVLDIFWTVFVHCIAYNEHDYLMKERETQHTQTRLALEANGNSALEMGGGAGGSAEVQAMTQLLPGVPTPSMRYAYKQVTSRFDTVTAAESDMRSETDLGKRIADSAANMHTKATLRGIIAAFDEISAGGPAVRRDQIVNAVNTMMHALPVNEEKARRATAGARPVMCILVEIENDDKEVIGTDILTHIIMSGGAEVNLAFPGSPPLMQQMLQGARVPNLCKLFTRKTVGSRLFEWLRNIDNSIPEKHSFAFPPDIEQHVTPFNMDRSLSAALNVMWPRQQHILEENMRHAPLSDREAVLYLGFCLGAENKAISDDVRRMVLAWRAQMITSSFWFTNQDNEEMDIAGLAADNDWFRDFVLQENGLRHEFSIQMGQVSTDDLPCTPEGEVMQVLTFACDMKYNMTGELHFPMPANRTIAESLQKWARHNASVNLAIKLNTGVITHSQYYEFQKAVRRESLELAFGAFVTIGGPSDAPLALRSAIRAMRSIPLQTAPRLIDLPYGHQVSALMRDPLSCAITSEAALHAGVLNTVKQAAAAVLLATFILSTSDQPPPDKRILTAMMLHAIIPGIKGTGKSWMVDKILKMYALAIDEITYLTPKALTCNDKKNCFITKMDDVSPNLLAGAKPLLPQVCEIAGAARMPNGAEGVNVCEVMKVLLAAGRAETSRGAVIERHNASNIETIKNVHDRCGMFVFLMNYLFGRLDPALFDRMLLLLFANNTKYVTTRPVPCISLFDMRVDNNAPRGAKRAHTDNDDDSDDDAAAGRLAMHEDTAPVIESDDFDKIVSAAIVAAARGPVYWPWYIKVKDVNLRAGARQFVPGTLNSELNQEHWNNGAEGMFKLEVMFRKWHTGLMGNFVANAIIPVAGSTALADKMLDNFFYALNAEGIGMSHWSGSMPRVSTLQIRFAVASMAWNMPEEWLTRNIDLTPASILETLPGHHLHPTNVLFAAYGIMNGRMFPHQASYYTLRMLGLWLRHLNSPDVMLGIDSALSRITEPRQPRDAHAHENVFDRDVYYRVPFSLAHIALEMEKMQDDKRSGYTVEAFYMVLVALETHAVSNIWKYYRPERAGEPDPLGGDTRFTLCGRQPKRRLLRALTPDEVARCARNARGELLTHTALQPRARLIVSMTRGGEGAEGVTTTTYIHASLLGGLFMSHDTTPLARAASTAFGYACKYTYANLARAALKHPNVLEARDACNAAEVAAAVATLFKQGVHNEQRGPLERERAALRVQRAAAPRAPANFVREMRDIIGELSDRDESDEAFERARLCFITEEKRRRLARMEEVVTRRAAIPPAVVDLDQFLGEHAAVVRKLIELAGVGDAIGKQFKKNIIDRDPGAVFVLATLAHVMATISPAVAGAALLAVDDVGTQIVAAQSTAQYLLNRVEDAAKQAGASAPRVAATLSALGATLREEGEAAHAMLNRYASALITAVTTLEASTSAIESTMRQGDAAATCAAAAGMCANLNARLARSRVAGQHTAMECHARIVEIASESGPVALRAVTHNDAATVAIPEEGSLTGNNGILTTFLAWRPLALSMTLYETLLSGDGRLAVTADGSLDIVPEFAAAHKMTIRAHRDDNAPPARRLRTKWESLFDHTPFAVAPERTHTIFKQVALRLAPSAASTPAAEVMRVCSRPFAVCLQRLELPFDLDTLLYIDNIHRSGLWHAYHGTPEVIALQQRLQPCYVGAAEHLASACIAALYAPLLRDIMTMLCLNDLAQKKAATSGPPLFVAEPFILPADQHVMLRWAWWCVVQLDKERMPAVPFPLDVADITPETEAAAQESLQWWVQPVRVGGAETHDMRWLMLVDYAQNYATARVKVIADACDRLKKQAKELVAAFWTDSGAIPVVSECWTNSPWYKEMAIIRRTVAMMKHEGAPALACLQYPLVIDPDNRPLSRDELQALLTVVA